MVSVSRGHHVDVPVRGELVLEHGAGVAGLHEPHPLAVQLLLVGSLQSLQELLRVNTVISHTNHVIITVVNEVGEHSVLRSSIEHLGVFLASRLGHSLLITRKDTKEDIRIDIVISIVHVVKATILSPITIGSGSRVREDLARVGVLKSNDGSISHVNDVLRLDSGSHKISVHTTRVLLITIIANTLR